MRSELANGFTVAVLRQDSGELIGDCCLHIKDVEARQAEIGYSFHPDHQGQGFAREAVVELLRFGFESLGLHRIYARCDARNTGSWRLVEALGMRREAHFREHALFKGGWDEEFYYAMLEDEWRNRLLDVN
jgi:RimJ/RimL family protein N-acetyltransferase